MREIKFRSWYEGKMYSTEDCDHTPLFLLKRGELMQYTGLKANGVEIYEGDIVKANGMFDDVIIFNDGGFNLERGDWGLNLKYQLEKYGNIEIIGNIYENPELKGERK